MRSKNIIGESIKTVSSRHNRCFLGSSAVIDRRYNGASIIAHKAFLLILVGLLIGSTILRAQDAKNGIPSEIQDVLHAQQEAWNRGDIDGFMNGYWRSDQTVFVFGDEVTRGWQKVLDRYKAKYSDRAKMGTLTFSEIEITALSNDSAVAFGRWELKRANDKPHGRFTLVFRKFPDRWKIVHDHTSAATTP